MNLFYISLLIMAFSASMVAQMPSIKIQQEGKKAASAVSLKKMDIEVEIFGNVAITTMKMVFHNNSSRILEGELTFPMPDGVTVSRYALDINGKLREAVPVAKAKATEVFESIEQRRVDPGLLERVEGNNFRTRVYPLPAKGNRTILVAYEQILHVNNANAFQYHLPLDYPAVIEAFTLQTKVYQAAQKPQFVEQPDGSFSFAGNSRIYEASMQKTKFKPTKALTINLPKDTESPEITMQRNTDGSYYFLINAFQKNEERPKTWSDRIGIIWDNSLSGLFRDKNKELALLDKIISQKQNLTVELGLLNISFRKAKSFTISNGEWSELKSFLQDMTYDGGTDFSRLNERTLAADEYLLFSDGLSTFGQNTVQINKPVYSICSSLKADFSSLKGLSNRTGGKYVNLAATSVDDAFGQISRHNLQFLGIQEKSLVSEVYPSAPTETNGHISVTGIIRASEGEITLLFGHNGKVERTQKVKLQTGSADIQVNRVWAQMKISEMDIQYEQNKADIELLGRQFGIVTRNTSLLVLEEVADYVRYDITPPAELFDEYDRLKKNELLRKEKRVNDLLGRAIVRVDELKKWWNTDFTPQKKFPTPEKSNETDTIRGSVFDGIENNLPQEIDEEEDVLTVVESSLLANAEERRIFESQAASAAEIAGRRASAQRESALQLARAPAKGYAGNAPIKQSQTATITIPKIRSDKDYIQRISSAKNPYAEYLSLRETYMGTPGFFFDVSDFFYDKRQNETGLLVLSCLAELDIENAELFKALAYKLKEKGLYEYELYITRKIKEWRPSDAQSHRDYALALQDNGKYQEAFECLYSILLASYSPEAAARDFGIEEVIACEINNLISRHKNKLDLRGIDTKIIADLPVHIRVVINWNKNNTDIDLWVTDPNGEKCFYKNKLTSSGGRMSADITQGFGPEQFMLKKAVNGKYKVETNFFGERQVTLSGPTTIMAEIYLYYSDGRQERKVVTFQSGEKGKEKEGVLIGEFTFSSK